MPRPDTTFADVFEQLRKACGLSAADIARRLTVEESMVSRWRRGLAVPSPRYVVQLAELFGVSRELLDGLAGYPASKPAGPQASDPALEAERQFYRSRYQYLIDSKVPRAMWRSYLDACEALAEGFEEAGRRQPSSAVTPPDSESVSTARDDGQPTDGSSGHGPLTAEQHSQRVRFPRPNRSVLSAAAS